MGMGIDDIVKVSYLSVKEKGGDHSFPYVEIRSRETPAIDQYPQASGDLEESRVSHAYIDEMNPKVVVETLPIVEILAKHLNPL